MTLIPPEKKSAYWQVSLIEVLVISNIALFPLFITNWLFHDIMQGFNPWLLASAILVAILLFIGVLFLMLKPWVRTVLEITCWVVGIAWISICILGTIKTDSFEMCYSYATELVSAILLFPLLILILRSGPVKGLFGRPASRTGFITRIPKIIIKIMAAYLIILSANSLYLEYAWLQHHPDIKMTMVTSIIIHAATLIAAIGFILRKNWARNALQITLLAGIAYWLLTRRIPINPDFPVLALGALAFLSAMAPMLLFITLLRSREIKNLFITPPGTLETTGTERNV